MILNDIKQLSLIIKVCIIIDGRIIYLSVEEVAQMILILSEMRSGSCKSLLVCRWQLYISRSTSYCISNNPHRMFSESL